MNNSHHNFKSCEVPIISFHDCPRSIRHIGLLQHILYKREVLIIIMDKIKILAKFFFIFLKYEWNINFFKFFKTLFMLFFTYMKEKFYDKIPIIGKLPLKIIYFFQVFFHFLSGFFFSQAFYHCPAVPTSVKNCNFSFCRNPGPETYNEGFEKLFIAGPGHGIEAVPSGIQ